MLENYCDGITYQGGRLCFRQGPEIEAVTPRSILRERIFLDGIEGQALDEYLIRNSVLVESLVE
jgi:hypothetical protein